jgi:hypothetical protein
VSAKKIRKRWPRSLANAPWFWAHADHAIVVFNGSSPGARPLLMAWKKDDEAWFLEGAPGPGLIAHLKAAWGGRVRAKKNRYDGPSERVVDVLFVTPSAFAHAVHGIGSVHDTLR